MLAVIASVIAIPIGIYSIAFAQFSGSTGNIGTIGNVGTTSGNIQTITVCGNGTVDASEECDDGNTVDGDGCSSTCTTETSTYATSTGIRNVGTQSLGSIGNLCTNPPCDNPPAGNVSPNFSGLNVEGYATINEDLTTKNLFASNDIGAGGKITANEIGSFYTRQWHSGSSGYTSVSCDSGTFLVGCSGYVNFSGKFWGAYPSNYNCIAIGDGVSTITAVATCFDPTGVTQNSWHVL